MPLKSGMIAATLGSALALGTIASPLSAQDEAGDTAQSQRTLLMADEFNGEELDREVWTVVGPEVWFNNE